MFNSEIGSQDSERTIRIYIEGDAVWLGVQMQGGFFGAPLNTVQAHVVSHILGMAPSAIEEDEPIPGLPVGTVRIVDDKYLDADGYVLLKNGERDKRYTTPYQ